MTTATHTRKGSGGPTRAKDETMRFIIEQAVLAPSSHNTQPWSFSVDGEQLELRADRTRALPVNDPQDRELTISCGAALFNARVAAAKRGRQLAVSLVPDGDESDILARAVLTKEAASDAALFPSIEKRHTYRRAFAEQPLEPQLVEAFLAGVAAEGARLEILDDDQRAAYIDLIAHGDRAQFANPSWRRELAAWMHPRRKGDGLVYSELTAPVVRFVVGHFDVGKGRADQDVQLAEQAPLVAVLATEGDSGEDWVKAGQALERALLVAASLGVQASYLNQPLQVAELRVQAADILHGGGFPQVALRLGHPTDRLPAAPRRPVDDVIEAS